MTSGAQKRKVLMAKRAAKVGKPPPPRVVAPPPPGAAPVNEAALAPYNSYGRPDFVQRGYYLDRPFCCRDCGVEEVWTSTQQRWWYEVAKGSVESTAKRCRKCRRAERERAAEARRVHLEGVARKAAGRNAG